MFVMKRNIEFIQLFMEYEFDEIWNTGIYNGSLTAT